MNAYVEGLKESPVSELKKSPIFAMSLSSKELFHSEFWAWLFARNIEYARIFFPNISTIENVGREEGNRDITVYSGGKGYVIENKVKSLPNVKQLEKYQKKFAQFESGVITSVIRIDFDVDKWRFLSYDEIGEKIMETAERIESKPFEKDLIAEYGKMIVNLSKAVGEYDKKFADRLITRDGYGEMSEIRMDDVLKKLNAEKFAKYLKDKFKDDKDIDIGCGFSKGNPNIDIKYKCDGISIGIQIQNGQYRRFVDNGNTDFEKTFEDENYQEWFDKEYIKNKQRIFDNKSTVQIGRYCAFKPGFVYQYWVLNEKNDNSFDILSSYIENDMIIAHSIIEKRK